MKNWLVVALMGVASLSWAGGRRAPAPLPTETPLVEVTPSPSPSMSPAVPHIGFHCVTCTSAEKKKVADAEKLVNELVQGECFEKFLLARPMIWTEGKTRKGVLDSIKTANLTVPVHFYRGRCKVVGYRNTWAPDVYFNRCHHDYYDAVDTASNALHEWTHPLGYGHPWKATRDRGYTVPYSMNAAVEKCLKGGHGFRSEMMLVN